MSLLQTKYDFPQVLKAVFDEPTNSLRVILGGGLDLILSSDVDSIALGDKNGKIVTLTEIATKVGLDVNSIGGIVTPQGFTGGLVSTEITVTDVPTKLPTTALVDRNAISVRVWNPIDCTIVVYFGKSDVTTANGYPKLHREEMVLNLKDGNATELYAVCETGKTAKVRIMEIG